MPTAKRAISSRVTIQNPRPRKYASAAERQKALRERFPTLCVRVEQEQADFMKRIADEQGRTLQDVHLAFIKYANGRGNLWLTQGLKGFAPLPRFEEPPKENPTMKRKPTPAQIAARERFAEMARSGAFKKKAAKRNPRKKTVSEKISQLSREGYPQKQAVAIALSEERAGKVKRNPMQFYEVINTVTGESEGIVKAADYMLAFDVFARKNGYKNFAEMKQKEKLASSEYLMTEIKRRSNPRASNPIKKFIVYTETKPGNWKQVRVTENLDVAKDLAKSNAESGYPSIVEDATGAIVYTPKVASNPIVLVTDRKRKANPVKRKVMKEKRPFYYVVKVGQSYDGQFLSSHYSLDDVKKIAQQKADKYGAQAKITELHV